MQYITAGKHAGNGGFHVFIYHRAIGAGVHLHAGTAAKFVFRDQANRQQHGIAVKDHLRAGYGAAVRSYLGDNHPFYAVFALNVTDGVGEIQGNIEIMQALDNVAGQASGIRHDLHAGQNFGSFQTHTASHDQANVTGTEDDHPAAYQVSFHVQIALRRASSEYACGSGTGNCDSAPGALTAAHGQDDRLGF